jgi:cobalt-zinc-cadmium efflux system protein
MTHDHSHHGHQHGKELDDVRLIWAVAVNVGLTLAQIIGGVLSGSLSLVADALHNLNDAASLGIALFARRIARRPANKHMTFGYSRAEVIAALINLVTLIIIGLYLVYEAILRFFQPAPIAGWVVVIVAGIALLVDIVTALLTYAMSKESLNVKAAFLHNVSDALASVGVIVAGTLIILYDLYVADLIVTLVIAAYVLYQGFSTIGRTISILMGATPEDCDIEALVFSVKQIDGVLSIHHVHVWELNENDRALEAHIGIDAPDIPRIERIKAELKDRIIREYRISHSTLEFEIETPPQTREDHEAIFPKH